MSRGVDRPWSARTLCKFILVAGNAARNSKGRVRRVTRYTEATASKPAFRKLVFELL